MDKMFPRAPNKDTSPTALLMDLLASAVSMRIPDAGILTKIKRFRI